MPQYLCRGPYLAGALEEKRQALASGDLDAARDADRRRESCGLDLTVIIDTLPADGEEYVYQCPNCGIDHSVRKVP